MQIKLSNAANWNDMISTFKFESETEIYELMSKQWLDVKYYKCILY